MAPLWISFLLTQYGRSPRGDQQHAEDPTSPAFKDWKFSIMGVYMYISVCIYIYIDSK